MYHYNIIYESIIVSMFLLYNDSFLVTDGIQIKYYEVFHNLYVGSRVRVNYRKASLSKII